MMVLLDQLNAAQRAAVVETDGPVMILAGAGSGKTRTLVARIMYLLTQKNIRPYQILSLTFSNKAAKEMRERIAAALQIQSGILNVTTFHAFCARVLRSEATHLGLGRNFTIYDTSEVKAIVKSLVGPNEHGSTPGHLQIMYYIEELKNNGHYHGRSLQHSNMRAIDAIDTNDEYYPYFRRYEEELHKSNALDFGGLITGLLQLFETFPEVLQRIRQKFRYILVDEYQDTNRAQFDLLTMLAGGERNLCVVGDEDQSIYSWRGADIRNILDFEKYFPEARILKLEQNYRSTKTIIAAAACVIAKNEARKGKNMWTENSEGDAIEVMECPSDKDEASYVAQKVQYWHSQGVSYDEMAIFYRSNAQSRLLEESLRRLKIPFRLVGGIKFYERKEIKDLMSYLRLLINPKDSLALARILNVPARGIGATSFRQIETVAVQFNLSLWEVIELIVSKNLQQGEQKSKGELPDIKLSKKVSESLKHFYSMFEENKKLQELGSAPSDIYQNILRDSGYLEQLNQSRDFESKARVENLNELLSAIKQYEQSSTHPSIIGFLESITMDVVESGEEIEDNMGTSHLGQVSLMTVHGSKGLEFTHVFLVGVEENVFPTFQSLGAGEMAMEEERRLFYVAMTRAMQKLSLSFAQARMLYGNLNFNGPSRFLYEIPAEFYLWKQFFPSVQASHMTPRALSGSRTLGQTGHKASSTLTYPEGSKIQHALYGPGVVLECMGSGVDEKVTIEFNGGVKKKFMVKFAPITLVSSE